MAKCGVKPQSSLSICSLREKDGSCNIYLWKGCLFQIREEKKPDDKYKFLISSKGEVIK
jgi:hypothetical protein